MAPFILEDTPNKSLPALGRLLHQLQQTGSRQASLRGFKYSCLLYRCPQEANYLRRRLMTSNLECLKCQIVTLYFSVSGFQLFAVGANLALEVSALREWSAGHYKGSTICPSEAFSTNACWEGR